MTINALTGTSPTQATTGSVLQKTVAVVSDAASELKELAQLRALVETQKAQISVLATQVSGEKMVGTQRLAEINSLQSSLATAQAKAGQVVAKDGEITNLKRELESLRSKAMAVTAMPNNESVLVAQLRAQLNTANAELDKQRAQVAQLTAEVSTVKANLAAKEVQITSLQADVKAKSEAATAAQAALDDAKKRIETLSLRPESCPVVPTTPAPATAEATTSQTPVAVTDVPQGRMAQLKGWASQNKSLLVAGGVAAAVGALAFLGGSDADVSLDS